MQQILIVLGLDSKGNIKRFLAVQALITEPFPQIIGSNTKRKRNQLLPFDVDSPLKKANQVLLEIMKLRLILPLLNLYTWCFWLFLIFCHLDLVYTLASSLNLIIFSIEIVHDLTPLIVVEPRILLILALHLENKDLLPGEVVSEGNGEGLVQQTLHLLIYYKRELFNLYYSSGNKQNNQTWATDSRSVVYC